MSLHSVKLVALLLAQGILVAVGCWEPLSARLTGSEVRLAVNPVDPIDPFRGAYVALDYPDLPDASSYEGREQDVYLPLERSGDRWRARRTVTVRPESGPYLSCRRGWRLDCGIDSWFVPQDEARRLETELQAGQLVAVVRVDARGNAALIGIEESAR